MKKFFLGLLATIMVIAIAFLLVSFIVANVHDLSVVDQWKIWGHGIANGYNKFVLWLKKQFEKFSFGYFNSYFRFSFCYIHFHFSCPGVCMNFWEKVGNFFKVIFSFIGKCFKWLFIIIISFFGWLLKTTVGKIITGLIAGIIVILLLYLFVKYVFIGILVQGG